MADKTRILIVDDDPTLRDYLNSILEQLQYEVAGTASSRVEAEKMAIESDPDLVIMDVLMETPRAGIDAARKIAKDISCPIIYLTTDAEESTLQKALQTEPFGYLVKPINAENLRASIEISLMRHKYEQNLRRTQAALEESESLFRGIYTTMQNGYYRLDAQERFLLANPSLLDLLGFESHRKIIGRTMDELGFTSSQERKGFRELLASNEKVVQIESVWRHQDGHDIHVVENAWEVRDDDGNLQYYEGTVQDISQIRMLESQLRHSQKLEVIGTMAGRIAHELNNRLAGVLGYADLLSMKVDNDADMQKYIQSIQSGTKNSAGVIQQLLKFSRKPNSQPHITYRLDELIEERRDILSVILSSKIEFREEIEVERPLVSGDPKQVEQIILNLVINARDAMPDGGVLTIRLSDANFISPYHTNGVIPHGDYVRLTISDTGDGIPEENIEKIFEPFFTTKEEGIGTGLGLSIVRSMVEDNHGFIRVDSQEGSGTQFEILLPVAPPRVD